MREHVLEAGDLCLLQVDLMVLLPELLREVDLLLVDLVVLALLLLGQLSHFVLEQVLVFDFVDAEGVLLHDLTVVTHHEGLLHLVFALNLGGDHSVRDGSAASLPLR